MFNLKTFNRTGGEYRQVQGDENNGNPEEFYSEGPIRRPPQKNKALLGLLWLSVILVLIFVLGSLRGHQTDDWSGSWSWIDDDEFGENTMAEDTTDVVDNQEAVKHWESLSKV